MGFILRAFVGTNQENSAITEHGVCYYSWWNHRHSPAPDVCINKPFKDRLRVKWQEWMITGEHTLTASGCTRKADLNVICGWIKDAWNDIPTEMIETSFRKCCITNAINGTEDDDIWEEETDPFDDFNDEFDDELYYADTHEKEQAGLADTFDEIFRNSYDEDFFGF